MKNFLKINLIILSILACLVPKTVFAIFSGELRIDTDRNEINQGEEFLVNIVLDSDVSLNAIEGELVYPSSQLELEEIRDGGSIINFWIERPVLDTPGNISFSGITPGGFMGKNLIFSLLFEAKNTGTAEITLQNIKILLNDGEGTEVKYKISNKNLVIKSGEVNTPLAEPIDTEPPEDFSPILSKDLNLFDGKYFVVFSTQDKISGIDYYKVREGKFGKYEKAVSPYLLKNQSLNKKIYIQAYDKAGNMRSVVFNLLRGEKWYKNILVFAIIVLLILGTLARKKLWRKFSKR